jgi:type II secretory pathway pseudopilin PulG
MTGGFWMSFHEFTSGYPWLTKRMAALESAKTGTQIKPPRRSIFAGVLATLVPNVNYGGGGGGAVIGIAIIGILAAVAIPAYQDYTVRAKATQVIALAAAAKTEMYEAYSGAGTMPASDSAVVGDVVAGINASPYTDGYAVYTLYSADESEIWVTFANLGGGADGSTIVFAYIASPTGLLVDCTGGTLAAKYRPANCR